MIDREHNTPNQFGDSEPQNAPGANNSGDSEDRPKPATSTHRKWTWVLVVNGVVLLVIGIGTLLLAIQMRSRDAADCLTYPANQIEQCQHTVSIGSQLAPAVLVVAVVIFALSAASVIGARYLKRSQRQSG